VDVCELAFEVGALVSRLLRLLGGQLYSALRNL
jgi:hypothetical protein